MAHIITTVLQRDYVYKQSILTVYVRSLALADYDKETVQFKQPLFMTES